MASDYNAIRVDAEITVQSLFMAIDGLRRIARKDPRAVPLQYLKIACADLNNLVTVLSIDADANKVLA